MIPDSLVPGIVIRAPDKTSARESGGESSVTKDNSENAAQRIEVFWNETQTHNHERLAK